MAKRDRIDSTAAHDDALHLQRSLRSLGDYDHVSVRALRGHLQIFVDHGDAVARLTLISAGQYGLSFHSHTGRWETMPFVGPLSSLAHDLVLSLGPYLQRPDFPDRKSGSGH